MREILFRGKDKLGNWHYGNLHMDTITGTDKCYINSRICVNAPKFIEVEKTSVGQYTGIKDMYGNSIYEGDIVEYTDGNFIRRTGLITFQCYGFMLNEIKGSQIDFLGTIDDIEEFAFKIIG